MREWQQTRYRDIVLPDAVFYETIWAVRDLERMEEQVKELTREINSGGLRANRMMREGARITTRFGPQRNWPCGRRRWKAGSGEFGMPWNRCRSRTGRWSWKTSYTARN